MKAKWSQVRLTDLCRPTQWKTIPMSSLSHQGYKVFGANGVIGFYTEFNHKEPTVLITCRGATCGALNISEPFSYITGNAMALDNLDPSQVDLFFLYWFLKRRGFNGIISGSAQPQITRQGIEKITIPLPPLPIQKKIAAILEKADQVRRKRQEALRLTDQFLQSAFMKMFGDPVKNPKRWKISKIDKIIEKTKNVSTDELSSMEITYVDISSVNNSLKKITSLTRLSRDKIPSRARQVIECGDILVSTVRPNLNAVAVVPSGLKNPIASTGFCVLRVNSNLVLKEYLFEVCKSTYFIGKLIKIAKGASYPAVSESDILNLEIPLPPVIEQQIFAGLSEKVNLLRDGLEKNEQDLTTLSQSLMQKVFIGDLIK